MRSLLTLLVLSSVAMAQTGTTPKTGTKTGAKTGTKTATHAGTKTAAKTAAPDPTQTFPAEPGLYVAFNTTEGRIVCKLFEKEAPVTVNNFTSLAKGLKSFTDPKTNAKVTRPFYNGLTFHRVIPNFMIQGGDPTGTGMGDGGVPAIADEFHTNMNFDQRGILAMANTGRPRSQATQFFITDVPYPSLNDKYSIFGQVVEGQETVTKIANVPRDASDKPNTPVIMKTVVIRRVGPAPVAAAPVKKPAASAPKTAPKTAPKM